MSVEVKPQGMYEIVTLEIVKKIFNKYDPKIEVLSYELKSGPEHNHFNSVMYHITAKLKREDLIKTMLVIFKSIPRNTIQMGWIRDAKLFLKETQIYQDILPILTKNMESKFTSFPVFLDAFSDGFTDYIALEDLQVTGFEMARCPTPSGLDWDHSVLTVKELAKFHGLSFIKYGGDGNKMQKDFPEIKEHFWLCSEPVPEMQQSFISNTMRDIEVVMKEEKLEHFIPRIRREFVENIFERLSKLSSVPQRFPSAFSHSDCWTNNIMYKYSEEGDPVELKFIDFQRAMVSSRCTDLAYLIYTSVSTPILNEKIHDLLKLYFETFTEFCSNIPLTFKGHELTWEFFLEEWEMYRHYGLIFGLMLIPLMYVTSEDTPDMELLNMNDIKQADGQKEHLFSKIWKNKTMREKLINLIANHLPE